MSSPSFPTDTLEVRSAGTFAQIEVEANTSINANVGKVRVSNVASFTAGVDQRMRSRDAEVDHHPIESDFKAE